MNKCFQVRVIVERARAWHDETLIIVFQDANSIQEIYYLTLGTYNTSLKSGRLTGGLASRDIEYRNLYYTFISIDQYKDVT